MVTVTGRTRVCAAMCVLAVSALVACGTTTPAAPGVSPSVSAAPVTTPTPSVPTTMGRLVGGVYTVGGPTQPATATPMPAPTPRPIAATVIAMPQGGTNGQGYETTCAADGSYSLTLPPGTYDVSATFGAQDTGLHATPRQVTITAGSTTQVDLSFYVP